MQKQNQHFLLGPSWVGGHRASVSVLDRIDGSNITKRKSFFSVSYFVRCSVHRILQIIPTRFFLLLSSSLLLDFPALVREPKCITI